MTAILIALALIAACVGAIYLILVNMGKDGVDAGIPGSCGSRKYGAQSWKPADAQEQHIRIDEITRKDARSDNQTL
jgi:hypothetical protein